MYVLRNTYVENTEYIHVFRARYEISYILVLRRITYSTG